MEISEVFFADHNLLLMLIVLLQDKGVISHSDVQERLRQTKGLYAARFGEGEATKLVEGVMKALGDKQSNVTPFPAPNQ